ncbi:nucleotidyltransferase domain-containing protein [Streptomyces sp. ECR3.8]|uniref:nucleotidyltransferase domain-containing protein n=1 Tax=Streptomyces sp. ECR3.8 TaxID=3461009 RepID=UPI004042D989
MPLVAETISEAFSKFLRAKTPQQWEREEISKYRSRIYDVLDAEYNVLSFYQSGSFSNGTGISTKSDVDYFAWIPYERKTLRPASLLTSIKNLYKKQLWEAHNVWVSRPTVSIDFRQLITQYEVTPAFYERTGANDQIVFVIPGPGDTWRESSPKAHLKYVRDSDKLHAGKVKGLARLLKAWKYEHSVPVSSFYLEMRAGEYGMKNSEILYPSALSRLMEQMLTHGVRAMNDPVGLVNRISPCGSESDRLTVLASMRRALPHLEAGYAKWMVNDWEASQEYQEVFGSDFPYVLRSG